MSAPSVDADGDRSTDAGPIPSAGAPPGPATVVVLGGLAALGPLTLDLYMPALPALREGLHSTVPAAQLTLTASLAGLSLGQLVFGPLSDRLGRLRPLGVGLAVYTLATVLCALAPSMEVLIGARLVQGVAGSAGLVISRAIARDRYEGVAMIRFLASLGMISGLAPIFAPVLGGQLLRVTTWRGTFVALSVVGAALTLGVLLVLRETLPPERRHAGGLGSTFTAIGGLLRDVPFLGYVLTSTFGFGALFAYVGGSSVVLQGVYHVSPQTYSLIFATNSVGVVAFTQLNGRVLAGRFGQSVLMLTGLGMAALAGAALIVFTTFWDVGLAGVWPALFLLMAGQGLILPNSAAGALTMAPHAAGSASALLGTSTFLCGAVVAPLSSAGGEPSAVALGTVVLTCALLATSAYLLLCRPWAQRPQPVAA
ncbi:multidrug effflux MFS transporter [Kitasatospora sp. NPDC048540]|uniref:multidrug effflux MFS transporter n=1 Tax=unclassified Kitasatospora TaxID=2633591 RepID=UPI000539FA71|nr:multidrug effflux MFS transporter [Kitasatospora sp. MBT63]